MQHCLPGPVNTDDRTVIEFALARSLSLTNGFELANLRASAHAAHADQPQFVQVEIDQGRLDEARLSIYPSLSRSAQIQSMLTREEKSRATAFASYAYGDLPGAARQWQEQTGQPKTLNQLGLVAECLAVEGDDAALPYIDKLAEALPSDAEAIRAELLWRQKRGSEAAESFLKFFQALHEDPWPWSDLIGRSMARANRLATSDRSGVATRFLYNALRTPLCVYVNETERLATVFDLAVFLDRNSPGENTLSAIEPMEPNVPWNRTFLEVRKVCYNAMHSPRAARATRDLNEFAKNEVPTVDVPSLTKAIESRATETTPNASSRQAGDKDSRQ
jgi:hypothetical protein